MDSTPKYIERIFQLQRQIGEADGRAARDKQKNMLQDVFRERLSLVLETFALYLQDWLSLRRGVDEPVSQKHVLTIIHVGMARDREAVLHYLEKAMNLVAPK